MCVSDVKKRTYIAKVYIREICTMYVWRITTCHDIFVVRMHNITLRVWISFAGFVILKNRISDVWSERHILISDEVQRTNEQNPQRQENIMLNSWKSNQVNFCYINCFELMFIMLNFFIFLFSSFNCEIV